MTGSTGIRSRDFDTTQYSLLTHEQLTMTKNLITVNRSTISHISSSIESMQASAEGIKEDVERMRINLETCRQSVLSVQNKITELNNRENFLQTAGICVLKIILFPITLLIVGIVKIYEWIKETFQN